MLHCNRCGENRYCACKSIDDWTNWLRTKSFTILIQYWWSYQVFLYLTALDKLRRRAIFILASKTELQCHRRTFLGGFQRWQRTTYFAVCSFRWYGECFQKGLSHSSTVTYFSLITQLLDTFPFCFSSNTITFPSSPFFSTFTITIPLVSGGGTCDDSLC